MRRVQRNASLPRALATRPCHAPFVCALLHFFSGAPRPRPTTHTLTQLRKALPPPFVELVELSHTLAHLTLSPPVHRAAPAVCRSTPPATMPSQTSPLSVTDDAQTLSPPHVRFSSSTHTAPLSPPLLVSRRRHRRRRCSLYTCCTSRRTRVKPL